MLTRIAFLILLLIFIMGCVKSAEKKIDRQIDEILNLSETRQVTQMFPELVQNELQSMSALLDSTTFNRIMKEAVRSYHADSLWKYTRNEFKVRYRGEYAEEVLHWLRSGTYKKIMEAENELLGYEDKQQILGLRDYLKKDRELQKRHNMLRVALQEEEIRLMVESFSSLERTLFEKVQKNMDSGVDVPPARIESMMRRDEEEMRRVLTNNAILERLYRYRYITVEELEAYVQFSNSAAGRWMTISAYESINAAVAQASAAFSM